MSVIVAKNAGFCFGVSRAVELVEQAAGEGKQVVTLGPIIHNRHVVNRFDSLGVKVIQGMYLWGRCPIPHAVPQ